MLIRSFLLSGLLLLSFCSYSQQEAASRFFDAVKKSDRENLLKYSSEEFIGEGSEKEEPLSLLKKDIPETISFVAGTARVEGGRAISPVTVKESGNPVDEVLTMMVNTDEGWKVDGLTESKKVGEHFMEGNIRGHFDVDDLPASKELWDVGTGIISMSEGKDFTIKGLEKGSRDGEYARNLNAPKVLRTGYSEKLGAGYISLEYEDEGMISEVNYYLRMNDLGEWEVFDMTFGPPSLSTFLSF